MLISRWREWRDALAAGEPGYRIEPRGPGAMTRERTSERAGYPVLDHRVVLIEPPVTNEPPEATPGVAALSHAPAGGQRQRRSTTRLEWRGGAHGLMRSPPTTCSCRRRSPTVSLAVPLRMPGPRVDSASCGIR